MKQLIRIGFEEDWSVEPKQTNSNFNPKFLIDLHTANFMSKTLPFHHDYTCPICLSHTKGEIRQLVFGTETYEWTDWIEHDLVYHNGSLITEQEAGIKFRKMIAKIEQVLSERKTYMHTPKILEVEQPTTKELLIFMQERLKQNKQGVLLDKELFLSIIFQWEALDPDNRKKIFDSLQSFIVVENVLQKEIQI